MLKLTYTSENGQSITFRTSASDMDNQNTPFILTGAKGLHGLESNIQTIAQYPMDGELFLLSHIKPRTIRLDGIITHSVIPNRLSLLSAFNPTHPGTLTLTRGDFSRRLPCRIQSAPSFDLQNGSIFTLTLVSPSPHWQDLTEQRNAVATWEGRFSFPFSIPPSGFCFGKRTESHVIRVTNHGDVPTGLRIVFLARGTVKTPSLIHVLTYEHLTLNTTLTAGDRAIITTGLGEKSVRLHLSNGTTSNAFALLDPESTFLPLAPGENLFRFHAETGMDRLDVLLYHHAQYLAV